MSVFIIKVSQKGLSKEYLFNKPGPITIGSDQRCDLWLDDKELGPKVLEVKLSGGKFYIRKVGAKTESYLNSIILPFREEVPYNEGDVVALKEDLYTIHLQKVKDLAEPPPFFADEFKEQLERVSQKIKVREHELHILEGNHEKIKSRLDSLNDHCQQHQLEKTKLECEIVALESRKKSLHSEIAESKGLGSEFEDQIVGLKERLHGLEDEERVLKDTILAHNLTLIKLKEERETKSSEVDKERVTLVDLQRKSSLVESKIANLNHEHLDKEQEILEETGKIQRILHASEEALKEKNRHERSMADAIKKKELIHQEMHSLVERHTSLEAKHKEIEAKLLAMRSQASLEESNVIKLKDHLRELNGEESHLQSLNSDLKTQIQKAEEKLTLKKNQLNQLEFQNQEAERKLASIHFEVERASLRLKDLQGEEKAQELKIFSCREEVQKIAKDTLQEKKRREQESKEHSYKLSLDLSLLKEEVASAQKDVNALASKESEIEAEVIHLGQKTQQLLREKSELESSIFELNSNKSLMAEEVSRLKREVVLVTQDKAKAEKDLRGLIAKLSDAENQIKERHEEALLAMENYKREERAKMLAEKDLLLSEVEAYKQRTLIEMDTHFRRKEDEVHEIKKLVHHEAEEIIKEARKTENEITQEAQKRLLDATHEAHARESSAHVRMKEAQDYFNAKEKEAASMIESSRFQARTLIEKTEGELMEDLTQRKEKIRNFISMKQKTGLDHLNHLQEKSIARLKKDEERAMERLEGVKRKELKKIARIREEELNRQQEIKNSALREVKTLKERMLREIKENKQRQESELAETKKTVLEHVNQNKFRAQETWQKELEEERRTFARTKKARIQNATTAVMNVLVAEFGSAGEHQSQLAAKIQDNLEMAIDGRDAAAFKEMAQVMDLNPLLRKEITPVLKRYALKVGLPVAVALAIMIDIGGVRTHAVNISKGILKQKQSASDIFVKEQLTIRKEKYTYTPATTPDYKSTYTDNVLYTTDFEAVMDNEAFQNGWILKVHDFLVKDMELSEDLAINFISSEGALVKELAAARKDINPQHLDQGIKKLQDLEKTHLGWLYEKINEPLKLERFTQFRKTHYEEFYQKEFKAQRSLASEKEEIK